MGVESRMVEGFDGILEGLKRAGGMSRVLDGIDKKVEGSSIVFKIVVGGGSSI